jgi:hypothetical protein
VQLTSQNFMRDVLAIQPEWLAELAPHFYRFFSFSKVVRWLANIIPMTELLPQLQTAL